MHEWVKQLESLALFVKRTNSEAITFILGAGASLSSGGPTTKQVVDALLEYGYFENATDLRLKVHELPDIVTASAISPLFENKFVPYLGYRAMAAIAHTHRVLVLNLNWDGGVQIACDAVGVKCESYDINEGRKIHDALKNPDVRVLCVHLHGSLQNNQLRLGIQQTLSFNTSQKKRLLLSHFLSHPTVIIGATLRGDTDMVNLLGDIEKKPLWAARKRQESPIWLLTCDQTVHEDQAIGRMLAARQSSLHNIYAPHLDFDRAMIWLNAELRGYPFNTFRDENRQRIELHESQLVLPRPEILRPHLDKKTIVLHGEPHLGKNIIGHFLAFFFHSLRPNPRKEDPNTKKPIRPRTAEDPSDCAALLENAKADDVILLENPFGATKGLQANPKFVTLLREGRPRSAEGGQTIVTSRESTWNAGVAQIEFTQTPVEIIDPVPLPATIGVISDHAPWYGESDLRLLVPDSMPHVAERIGPRDLNTPSRVNDAIAQRETTGRGFDAERAREAVDEKIETLRLRGLNVQRVVALLRLQKMSSHARTWERILEDAQIIRPETLEHALESHVYKFDIGDGQVFARLRHATDLEAVDELLADESSALLADLKNVVAERVPWVKNALRIREAIQAFRSENAAGYKKAIENLSKAELHEWAPTLLAVSPDAKALRILDDGMDLWALRDYVYEVVRLWPILQRDPAARDYLNALLKDRDRQGIYAILEAALYMKRGADDEIWSRIDTRLHDLFVPFDTLNFALAFDAMFWREAPPKKLDTAAWVKRLLERTPAGDPLRGAFAFSLVFHSNAAPEYLSDTETAMQRTLDMLRGLDQDQVTLFVWMLEWHFIHECRDRALMQRREQLPDEFQNYLRRSNFDSASAHDRRILEVACECLAELGYAGAAFLLAMNLGAIRGDHGIAPQLADLLASAAPADPYVIAAVMTFDLTGDLVDAARRYFARPENREALLDAFSAGVSFGSVSVAWPRFDACRDAFKVMQALHVHWPELKGLDAPLGDRSSFVKWVKSWTKSLSGETEDVRRLVKRLGCGDLRPLAAAASEVERVADEQEWTARVMTRTAENFHLETERAETQPVPDVVRSGDRLRDAEASGHMLNLRGAIADIVAVPPITREDHLLRAQALQAEARSELNAEKALHSARSARKILKELGETISPEDETTHKKALLEVAFPALGKQDRQKLLRDPIDALERVADLIERKEVPLPRYKWNKAARAAFHRQVAIARDAVLDGSVAAAGTQLLLPVKPSASRRSSTKTPPAALSARFIDGLADRYLTGISSPPTDLRSLFPRLQVKAYQEVSAIGDSGGLRREGNDWRIVVAAADSQPRKRFTTAHELAHIIAKEEALEKTLSREQLERFCNSLAAALLMPRKLYRAALGETVSLRSLREVAKTFEVSLHTAAIRCEELTGCPSFHVDEGRVDWTTYNVPPRLPLLRDVVKRILEGDRDIEPIFMTTRSHGGFWSVEFDRESDSTCTVFLRPTPLRTTNVLPGLQLP